MGRGFVCEHLTTYLGDNLTKPSILNDAYSLQREILSRDPGGKVIPRQVFDKLLVVGFGKSKPQADVITKTGEAAGLWLRRHNYATGHGVVEVFPATVQVQHG